MMKWIVLFGLVWAMCGCGRDAVLRFMPGAYVSEWKSEFSYSRDTLVISRREGGMVFDIVRRTKHEYERALKNLAPVYKIERWIGVYDEGVQLLYVQSNGRTLTFDPAEGVMKMGVVVYRKI